MFSSKHVPAYLDDLAFRVWKDKSGDEHKLIDLALRVEPLTTELAGEIHADVKGALFRRSSGEINERLSRVAFNIPIKPQSVAFRPDRGMKPSFEAEEVKVSRLVAKKDKGSPAWVCTFVISLPDCGADDLAVLQDALYKQHFVTFENAQPGLFDTEDERRRSTARSGHGTTSGLEAAPTH